LALLQNKILRNIVSSVDSSERDLVRCCSELIQLDSSNPPGDCTEIVSFLRSKYQALGVDFRTISASADFLKKLGLDYPRENFIAAQKSSKNSIGLAIGSHMDVVPAGDVEKWKFPPFSGKIADSKIWGRGAVDAKCSLAAQLFAMKALLESGITLNKSLLCIGTVDDEAPNDALDAGMKFVVDEGLKGLGYHLPRYAINAEASGLGSIWGTFSGGLTIRVSFKGKTGHPPIGVNALENAVRFWSDLDSKRNPSILPKPPRLVWFQGGSETHFGLTPEKAEIIFRISILDPRVSPKTALNEIRRIIKENGKLNVVEVSPLTEGRAFDIGKNSSLVGALKVSATLAGLKSHYGGGIVGPGDLQFFLRKGIQGVTYGAGSLERCHVPNEYVTIRELVAQTKIYALAAYKLCTS
jgi:succinyl-diaminopimelate desuccinylase